MEVGATALKMFDEHALSRLCTQTESTASAMATSAQRVGLNVLVQHCGRYITVHFGAKPEPRMLSDLQPGHPELLSLLYTELLARHGILTTPRQFYSLCTVHTDSQLQHFVGALEESLLSIKENVVTQDPALAHLLL
jgi:glutamate-1-semialdehyde aminotransferase